MIMMMMMTTTKATMSKAGSDLVQIITVRTVSASRTSSFAIKQKKRNVGPAR